MSILINLPNELPHYPHLSINRQPPHPLPLTPPSLLPTPAPPSPLSPLSSPLHPTPPPLPITSPPLSPPPFFLPPQVRGELEMSITTPDGRAVRVKRLKAGVNHSLQATSNCL